MNWYFIRHGQIGSNLARVYSGRSDEELTEEGRAQVGRAAGQLRDTEFDAVYSSPLRRTLQTAEILLDELGRDFVINPDEGFNEFLMGPWEGLPEAEVESRFPDEWATWNNRPAELDLDGRETLAELQGRVLDAMRAIERAEPDRRVLVVTHVAVIRVLTLFAEGRDLNDYKKVPVDNAKLFHFANLDLERGF